MEKPDAYEHNESPVIPTPPGKPNSADINGGGGVEHELPKGYFRSPLFIGTYVAVGLSLAAGVGAFSMAAPLLGIINQDIGPDKNYVWIPIAYTLLLTIGSTLVGRLTDIFGRRWFFIAGAVLATIGCIVAGTAHNVSVLIGAMVLIGAASAAQLSFVFVLGELVPMKYRFLANGGIYFMTFPFTVFGPAVSLSLGNNPKLGWRWVFYIMTIVNGLSAICWAVFYHPPTFHMLHRNERVKNVLRKFDYVGFVLFTGGVCVFVLGMSWGGSIYAWKSAHVIATIVIGVVTLVIFVLYECYATLEEPFIPMHLFANLEWVAVLVTLTVVAMNYYGFSIIWPQMLAALYSPSKNIIGIESCAVAGMITLGDFVSLVLAAWIPHMRYFLFISMIIGTALLGAVAISDQHTQGTTLALLIVGCFFTGMVESICLTLSGIAIKNQDEIGTAVGVAATVRSLGGTIASTIYVVVLTNRLQTTIPELVPEAVVAAGLPPTSVEALLGVLGGVLPPTTDVAGLTPSILGIATEAYKTALSKAFQTVFLVTLAFGILGIIGAFFCPDLKPEHDHIVVKRLHHKKEEVSAENLSA